MNFNLGNIEFKTKKATEKYVQDLVLRNHYKDIKLLDDDFNFLNDLIKLHPEYKEKVGDGIEYFHVKNHPLYNWLFLLHIKQKNKDELVVFSWKECLKKKKTTNIKNFKKALRTTIEPQRIEFKNSCNDLKCEMCSSRKMPQVDHIIHFEKILEDFLKINKEKIPISFNQNKNLQLEFKNQDNVLKNNWFAFHKEKATLRILCKTCNLERPKYKL